MTDMAVVIRKLGDTIELRYHDAPIVVPERARATIAQIVREHLELMLHDVAGHISAEAPVGVSGNLAQSFAASPATSSGGIELMGQRIDEVEGRIFSSLPYAIVIDQGREPGKRMPPVDAIMLWVERVLGITASDDVELEDTACAIARSIARKGIAARHFVDRGVERAMPRIEGVAAIMAEAIAIALTEPSGSTAGA